MAVSVSKAGPYYSSGQIKFSDLRRDFRAQQRKLTSSGSETFNSDSDPISSSELLRDTDTSEETPIVPDCTENRESGPSNAGISASNDWKVSQFRNSIKFYYLVQSGTDTNLDLDNQTWNSNLDKNILKLFFIDGVVGSNSTSSAAASLNALTHNLTIDVTGDVWGAGGSGGTSSIISGGSGGTALSVEPSSGNNVKVLVANTARIYGGGGGGEKGKNGAQGNGGYCPEQCTWKNTFCQGNAPGGGQCPGGTNFGGVRWVQCCTSQGGGCVEALWELTCCYPAYSTSGGSAGVGGNGGTGRGYNNQSGSLTGTAGTAGGSGGGCGASNGTSGETGGSGGEWGLDGGDTNNTGDGGVAGRAISGSNYSVNGTINSNTIKGLYQT